MASQWLGVREAAKALGVSEKTLRRRIKAGEVAATTVATAGGFAYRVAIDQPGDPPGQHLDSQASQTVQALLELVREKDDQIERLYQEKQELAQQLGMYAERVQNLNAQIRLLEAPKERTGRPWWQFWRRDRIDV